MFFIEIKLDYKCKYIAQTIYNKKFSLFKQEFITKIMKHNNQIFSSNSYFYILVFFFFLKWNLSLNFFIPPYLFETFHMMIFNVTCELMINNIYKHYNANKSTCIILISNYKLIDKISG
jgi:hypothetical protein